MENLDKRQSIIISKKEISFVPLKIMKGSRMSNAKLNNTLSPKIFNLF